jgi:hypothetical protein
MRFGGFSRSRHRLDRAAVELAVHLFVEAPDALECVDVGIDRAQVLELRRLSDEEKRVGVPEHVSELCSPARGVDRHEHGTEPAAGEEGIEELDPIAGDEENTVARADSGRS